MKQSEIWKLRLFWWVATFLNWIRKKFIHPCDHDFVIMFTDKYVYSPRKYRVKRTYDALQQGLAYTTCRHCKKIAKIPYKSITQEMVDFHFGIFKNNGYSNDYAG